jgi:hypothetical protein
LDKQREIELPVGRMRPLAREMYDRRAMTQTPGATGGRPSTGSGSLAQPLAAATGTETMGATFNPNLAPQNLGDVSGFFASGKLRWAPQPRSFLPQPLNRTLQEYTLNNQDMLNMTEAHIARVAELDPSVLDGFDSPAQAAAWAIAVIQRNAEPGTAPRMVDTIHQSRAGRKVYLSLKRIEEALNVES